MYLRDIFGDHNEEIFSPEQHEFIEKLFNKIVDEMTKAAAPDPDDVLLDPPEWYLLRKEVANEKATDSDQHKEGN